MRHVADFKARAPKLAIFHVFLSGKSKSLIITEDVATSSEIALHPKLQRHNHTQMIVIPNPHAENRREGPYEACALARVSGLAQAHESDLEPASVNHAVVRSLCRSPSELGFGMTIKNFGFCVELPRVGTAFVSAQLRRAKDRWRRWRAT